MTQYNRDIYSSCSTSSALGLGGLIAFLSHCQGRKLDKFPKSSQSRVYYTGGTAGNFLQSKIHVEFTFQPTRTR